MSNREKAETLLRLHTDPELLTVVNVWDVITATVVADLPATKALATASHSIAASYGYADGENIPVDTMIEAVGRIAAAVSVPVSADLEGGYGDAGETVRKAIGVGVVGANLEDQMKPLDEAVAAVRAVVAAGEAEGVPFVLNARTDAFVKAGDRPQRRRRRRRDRAREGVPGGGRGLRLRARAARRAHRGAAGRGHRRAPRVGDQRARLAAAGPVARARRRPGLLRSRGRSASRSPPSPTSPCPPPAAATSPTASAPSTEPGGSQRTSRRGSVRRRRG